MIISDIIWEIRHKVSNRKIRSILMDAIRSKSATMRKGHVIVKSSKTIDTNWALVDSYNGELDFEIPSESAFDCEEMQGVLLWLDNSNLPKLTFYTPKPIYMMINISKAEYYEIKDFMRPYIYKVKRDNE